MSTTSTTYRVNGRVTTAEIAKRFGVTRATVQYWIIRGWLDGGREVSEEKQARLKKTANRVYVWSDVLTQLRSVSTSQAITDWFANNPVE